MARNSKKSSKRTAYSYLRFSTPEQSQGDSKRRQLQNSRKLADQRGWRLDDSLRDEGVSGYTGRNVTHGDLGRFLAAIESGKVRPGSVLIVESLDRISRQKPLKAFQLFTGIIEAGVSIVTLMDGVEYTEEDCNRNPGLLYQAIGVLIRAYDESNHKSERIREAWTQKRKHARTWAKQQKGKRKANDKVKPTSAKCPAWCCLNKETGEFELVEEHAALMHRIIQMGLDGLGSPLTAITLNREGVKPLGRAKKWESSNIRYWWRSRTLIGEYQPCHMVDGRAVPDGDPIPGYYPALISDDVYYELQNVINTRNQNVAGRGARGVANLFGRRLKSGFDGSTMYLSQKRKANVNLVSAEKVRHDSDMPSFPYNPFEYHFLNWVIEVQLEERPKSGDRLSSLKGKLADVRQKISQVDSAIDKCDPDAAFDRLLDKLQKLNQDEHDLQAAIEKEKESLHAPTVDVSEIKRLLPMIKRTEENKNEVEHNVLRSRLRAAIHNVVDSITLYTYHKRLIRLAIAHVVLRDGLHRVFVLCCERYTTPVSMSDGMAFSLTNKKFKADRMAKILLDAETPEAMQRSYATAFLAAFGRRQRKSAKAG